MRGLRLFLVGVAALASCAAAEPSALEPVTKTEGALFHTFDCTATTPAEYGYADVFSAAGYNGFCVRVRGDVLRGSNSQGFAFTPAWPIKSIRLSTVNTYVDACKGAANGPSYAPCGGDGSTKFAGSTLAVKQLPVIAWPPAGAGSGSVVVGFSALPPPPLCPYVTENFPHPAFYESCGTWSPAGLPNIVAHSQSDPGSAIVYDIHTGAPCSCPHDAVIPADSQCNDHCP